nr:Uncharacterised protein [Streptococcus thermophilus]
MKRTATVWAGVVAAAVVLTAGIWLLGTRPGFEPVPQGDQLGPDAGESAQEYAQRAQISLRNAPRDEPVFALVTFSPPLSTGEAAEVLVPIVRVNAILPPESLPIAVGEGDRAHIFAVATSDEITGTVVWDTGDALSILADQEQVWSVEALPSDAVWGAFGIRPVDPLGGEL